MLFAKLKLYAIIGLGAFSLISAGTSWLFWGWYQDTKQELENVQIARDKAEKNLTLVSNQLQAAQRTRVVVDAALSDVRSAPEDEYETPLPPTIGNALRNFRDRMQSEDD